MLRKLEELKIRNITGKAFTIALDKTIQENLKSIPDINDSTTTTPSSSKRYQNSLHARQLRKKRDVASHFILRAAYCKTEELRRWFLSQETFLFKYQLDKLAESPTGGQLLRKFLNENELLFDIVSDEEKAKVKTFLMQIATWKSYSAGGGNGGGANNGDSSTKPQLQVPSIQDVNNTIYFKIHFSEASDLIAKRQCYVHKGYAYVPLPKIVSIVTAKFRRNLSLSLAKASRVFDHVSKEYAPVAPLLQSMHSQYTGEEYTGANNKQLGDYQLNAHNVDEYASSMPLCMSQLHTGLKQDSKLRHHARWQYGLFLKGAGMTMEESLIFFQQHFTKIMSSDKFQKEYSYNIRHMYGKEGKRTNYSALNCSKIIMGAAPSGGDHHGCPYKHYDTDHLSSLLNKMKIGTVTERTQIMALKKNGHYNLACLEHLKATHPDISSMKNIDMKDVGSHPNSWYAASVAYNQVKNGVKKESVGEKSEVDESPAK